MHRSRLAGFIIDSQHADLDTATRFWSKALGMPDAGEDGATYRKLDATARDLAVEIQNVDHPSRVHLDIESDDVDAEADRLEALGAKRIARIRSWWVLEAPTGHRFCVIQAKGSLAGKPGVSEWP